MTKKTDDNALKQLLARHDEIPPGPPSGEWAAIRARVLAEPAPRTSVRRLGFFAPARFAAAAMIGFVLLRGAPETSPEHAPLPAVSVAALPAEDRQIEALLSDDSYFEGLEALAAGDEGYLALLD